MKRDSGILIVARTGSILRSDSRDICSWISFHRLKPRIDSLTSSTHPHTQDIASVFDRFFPHAKLTLACQSKRFRVFILPFSFFLAFASVNFLSGCSSSNPSQGLRKEVVNGYRPTFSTASGKGGWRTTSLKTIIMAFSSLLLLHGTTFAGMSTATMTVEATVEPHCLVAVTDVSFGPSDGTTVKLANGVISVTCQSGIQYSVALNGGLNPIPSVPVRTLRMSGAQTYLGYELYKDSGRTTIWGDGTTYPAGTAVSSTSSDSPNNHAVYGKLDAFSTSVTLGGYSDIVDVTVTY